MNEFLKEIPSEQKDFYDKFISETQLFGDYLYKRMIPKNSQEKIRVLLFDETINEYHKNIFGKNNQCVFINTNEYNFEEKYEIQKPREVNDFEKKFFLSPYTKKAPVRVDRRLRASAFPNLIKRPMNSWELLW